MRTRPQGSEQGTRTMFQRLWTLVRRLWGRPDAREELAVEPGTQMAQTDLLAHDNTMLERCRTQWQFGDWESLAALDADMLRHHPDRAKLALLAMAGQQQAGNDQAVRQFARLAAEWGCDRRQVGRILIAGVHNTLGKAAAAANQQQRACAHFEQSVGTAMPGSDRQLLGQARTIRETARLGLLPQAGEIMAGELAQLHHGHDAGGKRMQILQTEVELLRHELSLALQRQQLYGLNRSDSKESVTPGGQEWLESLKRLSVSQLGQDLWVLEKTAYKRDGYFVEFGASDGILLSNTYLLEKEFSWNGICAEPNEKAFEQLQKNRRCIVSNACIGNRTGEKVTFILADAYGGIERHSDNDKFKDTREAYKYAGFTAEMTTISLDDFLKKHDAPQVIDYISIDTEGSEYDILKDFPFENWELRLLTIEHNYSSMRQPIRQLLEKHGYQCQESDFDDWYFKSIP